MEISVILFIVFNINLVLTDDNVAVENNVAYQDNGVSEPLNNSEIDQIAESSHSISQTYNNAGMKNNQEDNQNQVQYDFGKNRGEAHDGQNKQQVAQHPSGSLSQNNPEILQPALTQGYPLQGQPIYVQYPLQPIRIFGAEASPLYQNQLHQNEGQTLGYTSYIEHLTQKDEEEIKSALKQGSISDIKRLVPKSGISFKIYKNEKKNPENSKPQMETDYSQYSKHHRVKVESPATHHNSVQYQTVYKQQQPEILQQTYQQHGIENSHLLQSDAVASHSQDHQSVNEQTHYFTQPEINSPKTFLEINGKTSHLVKPHFKLNGKENNYNKATSTAEYNLIVNRGSKHGLTDISNYPKQWKFDTKSEGSQRAVKKIKPILQYQIDPVAVAERNKVYYTQTNDDSSHVAQNFNKQKTIFAEAQKGSSNANYQSSYAGKVNENGYLAEEGYSDRNLGTLKNRQPGNYADNTKQGQNYIVNHLGLNTYADSQAYKASQSEYFPTTSHPDNEPAKSGQHLITHIDTKNIQSFDHQKALEGSTSFDIKNAIDTTGSLIHQTNHVTSETHSFDDLNKHQLAFSGPKIPTSTVLLDSEVQETPVVEGHQIKDFGISSPQFSYHTVSSPEVNGKFLHQPQTVVWSSEHLKQGNALPANDLHQPLIKLHLPKEEFYQQVKTPNVELPTISHISYQQKQPIFHYDTPFVKFPQEIHFQPKTKIRIQNQGANLKLGQPLAIDWSLFKSTFPNFNVNSLTIKPEPTPHIQEMGKKIVPILVRKRKNRSNNKQEIGVIVYGKMNNNRRPMKPSQRQEKNVRINLLPEASSNMKQFEPKRERKNEFSVSASYKVDRSFKTVP